MLKLLKSQPVKLKWEGSIPIHTSSVTISETSFYKDMTVHKGQWLPNGKRKSWWMGSNQRKLNLKTKMSFIQFYIQFYLLYTIFPNLKYLSTFFRYRTLGVRGRGNSQSIWPRPIPNFSNSEWISPLFHLNVMATSSPASGSRSSTRACDRCRRRKAKVWHETAKIHAIYELQLNCSAVVWLLQPIVNLHQLPSNSSGLHIWLADCKTRAESQTTKIRRCGLSECFTKSSGIILATLGTWLYITKCLFLCTKCGDTRCVEYYSVGAWSGSVSRDCAYGPLAYFQPVFQQNHLSFATMAWLRTRSRPTGSVHNLRANCQSLFWIILRISIPLNSTCSWAQSTRRTRILRDPRKNLESWWPRIWTW